jgi:hypothetical protein
MSDFEESVGEDNDFGPAALSDSTELPARSSITATGLEIEKSTSTAAYAATQSLVMRYWEEMTSPEPPGPGCSEGSVKRSRAQSVLLSTHAPKGLADMTTALATPMLQDHRPWLTARRS